MADLQGDGGQIRGNGHLAFTAGDHMRAVGQRRTRKAWRDEQQGGEQCDAHGTGPRVVREGWWDGSVQCAAGVDVVLPDPPDPLHRCDDVVTCEQFLAPAPVLVIRRKRRKAAEPLHPDEGVQAGFG